MTTLDGRKTPNRKGRDICLDRKNHSCDARFGRHPCNLSMHSMLRDMTKRRGNHNVKLYLEETNLFYGAKMLRQFSLQ